MKSAPSSERNPTVESWIASQGAKNPEFVVVDLAEIDQERSHANQARFKPLDELTVNRYAILAATKTKFPPFVLGRVGERLILIDGNQRYAAFQKAGIPHHFAYIVDVGAAVMRVMTATANTMNGLSFTDDEKYNLVIQMNSLGTYSQKQIGSMAGFSENQVGTIVQAAATRARAANQRMAARVSDTDMTILHALGSNDALDMMVYNQLSKDRLPSDLLRKAVTRSNRQHNDEDRMRVCREAISNHIGHKTNLTRVRKDGTKLTTVITIIKNLSPLNVALEVENRDVVISQVKEAQANLDAIIEALT